MPQSDNLYTLDAVDTNLTATTQVVKALQVATTDVSTQRLNEGLASFGAAIGQVATRKRAERVKEDIRTAKNAAIRNESMPGGLAIESVEAYNYTTSVVAGNEHLKTAGMYYEGDEFKAILNSTELTEDQKIASIEQSSSEFLLNGQYALNQHPDLYLKYMNGLDAYKTEAIKSIHGVEKTKQEFTGIQAMQGQIENRIKDGIEMTGEYIVNLAESYRKATPWVDPDVAKITALNLVLSAPETTSQTLAAIMKSEYAKGVGGNKGPTFGSLANSQTGAGKLIFQQVTAFTARRKREKAEAKQAEIDRETDLNNKGLKATEEFVSSLKTDDPNRISQVNQFMTEQGMTGKARTSFMRIYKGDLENSTQDSNSDDYDNLADQILEDYLTGREAIQDAAAAHNLSGEAVGNLLTLDANTKSLVNTYRSRIIADGATLNNSADAGLLSALAGSSGSGKLARLLDPRLKNPSVSSAEKVSIMMRKGVIKVPYADKIPVLMDLLEIRKQFDKGAREEARLAVIEDREPDSTALINRFQTRVTNLLNRLNTPTVQVPPKDSKDPKDPKVPKDPSTGTIDKTKILDAATGDPEAGQSLVDSVLDMFTAKVEKDKSFREMSESNRMDKPSVKTTPEVPQEKPTQDNILGSSSTPSITQRAKLLSLNPEGRRGTSAFKQEVRETGQIEDKESAIAENLSYFNEAVLKKEQAAWGFFSEIFDTVSSGDYSRGSSSSDPLSFFDKETSTKETPNETTTSTLSTGGTDVGKVATPENLKTITKRLSEDAGVNSKHIDILHLLESSGGKNLTNPDSSAKGEGQIIDSTARTLAKRLNTTQDKIQNDTETNVKGTLSLWKDSIKRYTGTTDDPIIFAYADQHGGRPRIKAAMDKADNPGDIESVIEQLLISGHTDTVNFIRKAQKELNK